MVRKLSKLALQKKNCDSGVQASYTSKFMDTYIRVPKTGITMSKNFIRFLKQKATDMLYGYSDAVT